MKSEKFDEAIRRKFEDMENEIPVSDKALDALQQYVNAGVQSPLLYATYMRSVLLISFIGFGLASLFSWSLFMQFRHSEMTAQIDSLEFKLKHPRNNQIVYKTDTIYMTGANKTNFERHPVPRITPSKAVVRYVTAPDKKSLTSNTVKTIPISQKTFGNNKLPGENNPTHLTSKGLLPNPGTGDSLSVNNNSDNTSKVQTAFGSADTNQTLTPDLPAGNYLKDKLKSMIVSLKNIKIQAGIGMQKGKRQSGNELLLGLHFTQRWNLSTGIRFLKVNHERYENNEGIDQLNGSPFPEFHPAAKIDTAVIRNIGTQSAVLQIPLTLSYTLPLKKEYALLFGIGTDVDLASRQHIDYDRLGGNLPVERKNFDTKNAVLMINNVVVSAGIQKEWKKFSLQLSPFVSQQITPVIYKNDKLYTGMRFRIFYNFGK
jgi:hypothetical protein